MSSKKTLTLREVQYLIANKPLAIVKLEHSPQNKKLIVKALAGIGTSPNSLETLATVEEFLRERAPKYNLNKNENGAREFLIREIRKHITAEPAKKTGFFSGLVKMVAG
ncbi:hypothetical protein [Acanthopleuribacter pedis]|uniref:Uncharacterized protein n=1 Tax=Acanthopleuribacter pedis TaxID=442870 RepID=A0A8J7QNA1_9BACT|nr:hypothetical protein [Acanthopleuribacter pedis]MBO1322340.1 hypothetical protein [Acanthopleuribacter pedis]